MSLTRRLAAQAPVPVLTVAGAGARGALLALRASAELELVASPRHATVLLVGGAIPEGVVDVAAQVHDQLPEPRAVVWWGGDEGRPLRNDPTVSVGVDGDVVETIRRVHRELLSEERPSTPPAGAPSNPVDWQGAGEHGQGGEGMMGGQPYGRPMAMTGPDVRDGLQLDRVPLRVGPALPGLPPGLSFELELQGDVIQQAEVGPNPFASGGRSGQRLRSVGDVFDTARERPVPVAEIELARARYHLLRCAEALALHGLGAAGRRMARLAVQLDASKGRQLVRIRRWLEGAGLWGATASAATIDADTVRECRIGGVVARAAGVPVDARLQNPAYRALGFEVTTRRRGDARARWLQRMDEAIQALSLTAAAEHRTTGPGDGVEDPRSGSEVLLEQLPHWLVGLEWGDAVTMVSSLDLDLEVAVGHMGHAESRA